jgi:dTMP kinase
MINDMLLTLEGIEGSGKTTQLENIIRFLEQEKIDFAVTREPGGTLIGEKIRAILLDPESHDLDPLAELLLYSADRAQHVKKKIIPLLSKGKTVVCDRFYDATVTYQGFARGIDMELINRLNQIVLEDLKPDLTILFDLPASAGLKRAWRQLNNGSRTSGESRFEKEAIDFHEKVRSGYLELAKKEPGRFRIVDAALDKAQVQEQVKSILSLFLNARPDIVNKNVILNRKP